MEIDKDRIDKFLGEIAAETHDIAIVLENMRKGVTDFQEFTATIRKQL